MRMKKTILGICIGSLFGITGCGAALPEMTQEQENAIVEYAANLVMRYTRDYDSKLVDLSLYEEPEREPEKNPEEDKQEEQDGMDPVADTPVIDSAAGEAVGNIAQVLLPEGMDIRFTGYRLADSYPDDDSGDPYFALDAAEGNTYLILGFVLSNNTGAEQEIDIYSTQARFTVLINGTERRPVYTTLVLDDLSTYVGTLGAGEEVELVLLPEIDDALAGEISELRLSATTSTGSVMMLLE